MNKNKIGLAVLLLGLSLGPVQTSQNYSIRLNNLVYAEGEQGDDPAKSGDEKNQDEKGVSAESDAVGGKQSPGKTTSDAGSDSDSDAGNAVVPLTDLEKARLKVKKALEDEDKAIKASEAYNLATKEEKDAYDDAYKLLEESINEQLKDENQVKDIDNIVKDFRRSLISESLCLGYTVVQSIPLRIGLRNLKADLDAVSKEAEKDKKPKFPSELKNQSDKADDILKSKEYSAEVIKENYEAFSKALEKYKSENSITIQASDLSLKEANYGYPDDVYTENRGKEKDLSEVRLDVKFALEETKIDDKKVEERIKELKKKVEAKTASKEETTEYNNLTRYQLLKLALAANLDDPDAEAGKLVNSLHSFVDLSKEVTVTSGSSIDKGSSTSTGNITGGESQKTDDFAKRLKAIRDSHKDFIASDKFKKADEKLRKTYEDAYNALNGTTEYSLDAKSKIEAVEKAKRDIEKVEEDVLISKIATALNVDKNKEFTESENFRRAPKKLKEAYKKAFEDLGKKKTEENLKAFEEAKKAIEDKDFAGEFNDKLKALEKYIDQAKSDNLTEDSLKKLKKEYADKLKDLKDNKDANVDDLKALEDDFNKDLNPEKPEKGSNKAKTTKRVVSTKKNAGGKVRTGVESVLPLAGGVLVVAAIALVLTRKKNK